MKPRAMLLTAGLLGFVTAQATNDDPIIGKKDEMNGVVLHAETKKPLKDVSVTAYLASKKEVKVTTDEAGGFAFDELKPGVYKFVFEKAGFRKITKEKIVIKEDETLRISIELSEAAYMDIMPSPFHFGGGV